MIITTKIANILTKEVVMEGQKAESPISKEFKLTLDCLKIHISLPRKVKVNTVIQKAVQTRIGATKRGNVVVDLIHLPHHLEAILIAILIQTLMNMMKRTEKAQVMHSIHLEKFLKSHSLNKFRTKIPKKTSISIITAKYIKIIKIIKEASNNPFQSQTTIKVAII
jgi:hypothetical protein